MKPHDCDVLVVGAGFAGAAAAVALRRLGLSIIVLEARDRVGGRAYSRPFAGTEEIVELGGNWITPWQRRIRRHAGEHGMELRQTFSVTQRRYHDGDRLRKSPGDATYAATMDRIARDALAYEQGDRSIVSLSLDDYLAAISAATDARAQVYAWWTISGNGPHDRVSAAEFLASCAYGEGRPEGMLDKLRHCLIPGASILVQRMVAKSGARLVLGRPVAAIAQDAETVAAIVADGQQFRALHMVCCLPLNVIGRTSFQPGLPDRQRQAARIGHLGSSVKLWIKARGMMPGTLATGGLRGLQWLFGERPGADGETMVVAFGFAGPHFDPGDASQVAAALKRHVPEADYLGHDWHDWVGDPFSRGTWVALPAQAPWIADSAVWQPHGRVHFAGSDIAAESPGWFEAAISSGEAAAHAIGERLGRVPAPVIGAEMH